jgi:peptide-methionine (R)-S-oxide reductase
VKWLFVSLALAGIALAFAAVTAAGPAGTVKQKGTKKVIDKIVKTEEQWKQELTPEQFHVLRKQGTERAFTGALWNNHDKGIYVCAACGLPLFSSDAKFDSGTGWPSYWQPIDPAHVETESDRSLFMVRTEVHCARCGGHLGHVFEDGPKPTGLRYCINSVSLRFEPEK